VNGLPVDASYARLCGFATQEAPFLEFLTVQETLRYAALLRLPNSLSPAAKTARVDAVIRELDLDKCRHTFVGKQDGTGGISGGERRRLILAMELLYDPMVLLCDEPTSALDSASAVNIVCILKKLANQGRTIICTLHQPRASLLPAFDQLLLLSEGRTIYYGPTWTPSRSHSHKARDRGDEGKGQEEEEADGMLAYFAAAGFPFSRFENPADELLDRINGTRTLDDALAPEGAPAADEKADDNSSAKAADEPLEVAVGDPSSDEPEDAPFPEGSKRRDRDAVTAYLAGYYRRSQLARFAAETPPAYPPLPSPAFSELESPRRRTGRYPTSWCTQFSVIARRAFFYKLRCPDAFASQVFASVVMGIIIGTVYFKLPLTDSGARDRLAAISFMTITQSFMAFDLVVLAPHERAVMLRDTAAGMYSGTAFYAGRTLAEAPVHLILAAIVGAVTSGMFGLQTSHMGMYVIIMVLVTNCGASLLLLVGAVSKSMAAGNALATLVLTFSSLFNGFFITKENVSFLSC
jgi:ABC-type multidrug transport system ATPase subunit